MSEQAPLHRTRQVGRRGASGHRARLRSLHQPFGAGSELFSSADASWNSRTHLSEPLWIHWRPSGSRISKFRTLAAAEQTLFGDGPQASWARGRDVADLATGM